MAKNTEIELKLFATVAAHDVFRDQILPTFGKVKISEGRLLNEYFDTSELFFRNHMMGFRLRDKGDKIEQTIKAKGQVAGGLHQRKEYNIPLSSFTPDLRLFPTEIWPENTVLEDLQADLKGIFRTDFHRTSYQFEVGDARIECVFDEGEITASGKRRDFYEIELELLVGKKSVLFDLARRIAQVTPVRINNLTKAAYGYALANDELPKHREMQSFLKLKHDTRTEDAFIAAAQYALGHWQYHQTVYRETLKLQALTEMVRGMQVLLQAFSLYLPVLQCRPMLNLHQRLIRYSQRLAWQDEVQHIRYLCSKKGPFTKTLTKDDELLSYLQGRKDSLLTAHDPIALIDDQDTALLQLDIATLLHSKPWRADDKGYQIPVKQHAHGWLSQGWQLVLQSLSGQNLTKTQYLSAQLLLRQTLFNGFMLAGLFFEGRDEFRGPWLDLSIGMDELNALALLQNILHETEFSAKEELHIWSEMKVQSLLKVMEMTRLRANSAEVYW